MSERVVELIEALQSEGVRFRVEGDRVRATLPKPTPSGIISALDSLRPYKADVRAIIEAGMLADALPDEAHGVLASADPPSLPRGVRLLSYCPKTPPVAVTPISVVTDVNKFIGSYLRDLEFRLEHPKAHACASLNEILAKLAEVGVELALDPPIASEEKRAGKAGTA
jgi:hypothetical protein